MCLEQSRFSPAEMFDELVSIGQRRGSSTTRSARSLSVFWRITVKRSCRCPPPQRITMHTWPAFSSMSCPVTKTCVYLADKYDDYYPDLQPRLDKGLVVAGAILHDIGKLREIQQQSGGAEYTSAGALIGHIVQGRDVVREAAARLHSSNRGDGASSPLDPDTLLRLEHIILSHQRLPEWGSPKPPMTPEALIVHYADDLDAKYNMMYCILRDNTDPGAVTSKKNVLFQQVYKGDR